MNKTPKSTKPSPTRRISPNRGNFQQNKIVFSSSDSGETLSAVNNSQKNILKRLNSSQITSNDIGRLLFNNPVQSPLNLKITPHQYRSNLRSNNLNHNIDSSIDKTNNTYQPYDTNNNNIMTKIKNVQRISYVQYYSKTYRKNNFTLANENNKDIFIQNTTYLNPNVNPQENITNQFGGNGGANKKNVNTSLVCCIINGNCHTLKKGEACSTNIRNNKVSVIIYLYIIIYYKASRRVNTIIGKKSKRHKTTCSVIK